MKNKKGISSLVVLGIILFVVTIFGTGTYFFLVDDKVSQEFVSVPATPGCTFLKSIDNPTSSYTKVLKTSTFTCKSSECIVSGSVSVTKGIGITTWDRVGSKCSIPFSSQSTCLSQVNICNNFDSTGKCASGSGNCPGQTCVQSSSSLYQATFNLCPLSDPNFAYCTGTKNSVSSTDSEIVYYTDEKRILNGETITFTPKNSDGSDITERYIRVKEYDCSCIPAVQEGLACSSEQKYCSPIPGVARKIFCETTQTYNKEYLVKAECESYCGSTCISGGSGCPDVYGWASSSYTCEGTSTNYNNYQRCDSTQTIGQSTCGKFSNTLVSCPTGQSCYLDATGEVGEGLGGCRCPNDPCILGEKEKRSDTTYRQCITVGSCLGWSSELSCPSGLVFDQATSQCVCNPDNSCNPQEAECVGDSIRKCQSNVIGGKTCYSWQTSALSCPGEMICDDRGTTAKDDICSCEDVNECTPGEIKCIDKTHYSQCTKDPNNIYSCSSFRGSILVDSTQECVNNIIQARDDIGCAYNTPGYVCSTEKDLLGIPFEKCIDNVCVPTQDDWTAFELDYSTSSTRCVDNTVYKVSKYTTLSSNYYRWEIKTDAISSTIGVCNDGYHCGIDGSIARCLSDNEFMGITTKGDYGVGERLSGIKIELTDKVSPKSNVPAIVWLSENDKEIAGTRITNLLSNSKGEIYPIFAYSHPRVGTIDLNVLAGDPKGVNYRGIVELTIAKTLEVKLSCPSQGVRDRDVTCTFKVVDKETNTILTNPTLDISVTQGVTELSDTSYTSSSVRFKSPKSGSVEITIKASRSDYLSGDATASVPIQEPSITQSLLIDNKDSSTYYQTGITTGIHQITFKVEESGEGIALNSIQATIRIPSGAEMPLLFTQSGTDDTIWKSSYNLADSGRTYVISGDIIPEDITKAVIPFEYKLTTVGTSTEDLTQQRNNIIWIVVGIGLAVLILVILVIILVRGGGKRRR